MPPFISTFPAIALTPVVLFKKIVPSLMVVSPVKVLANVPEYVRVPELVLVNALDPFREPERVKVVPVSTWAVTLAAACVPPTHPIVIFPVTVLFPLTLRKAPDEVKPFPFKNRSFAKLMLFSRYKDPAVAPP